MDVGLRVVWPRSKGRESRFYHICRSGLLSKFLKDQGHQLPPHPRGRDSNTKDLKKKRSFHSSIGTSPKSRSIRFVCTYNAVRTNEQTVLPEHTQMKQEKTVRSRKEHLKKHNTQKLKTQLRTRRKSRRKNLKSHNSNKTFKRAAIRNETNRSQTRERMRKTRSVGKR